MQKIKILISLLATSIVLPFAVYALTDITFLEVSPGISLPTAQLGPVVARIANVVFYATVLIAFIMVVWGGVTMATAAGDPSKVDLARHMILYALIAIAVGAIAWGLVSLVASYISRA